MSARGSGSCYTTTMTLHKLGALVLVVLLSAFPRTESSSARQSRSSSETVTVVPEILALELMQYHHVKSPLAQRNLTLAKRVEIAVRSSRERAQVFHSQRFGTETDHEYSSPVYSGEGSYIMEIQLGTPARTLVAIADTGSDLVWVQCSPCEACFDEPDPAFDPRASSTYRALSCTGRLCSDVAGTCSKTGRCRYAYGYGDLSSTEGTLASDTVTFRTATGGGRPRTFRHVGFGCGVRNEGRFGPVDGLVGLGQGPLSLVTQLGSRFGNLFSYCLVDFYSAMNKSSLLLFGSDGGGWLRYTPLLANPLNPTFYYVDLIGITVDGKAIKYPTGTFSINETTGIGGFILDCGTSLSQLAMEAYEPLVSRLTSLISYPRVDLSSEGLDLCYDLSDVENPSFPSVVFKLQGGVNLALPANNVFLLVNSYASVCLAIGGSPYGLSIMGNVQQQNFQIAFDRAKQRVGFAPKNC